MKRKTNHFTPYEIELLRQNPNTHCVTSRVLSFTAEFKRQYWERYQAGHAVVQIFEDAGYDPLVVGYSRMHSFAQNLRKVVREGREFKEFGRRSATRQSNASRDQPDDVESSLSSSMNSSNSSSRSSSMSKKYIASGSVDIEKMQYEIVYLRQHVEFLKKLSRWKTHRSPETDHGKGR